jgi:hypothetical protein
MPVIMLHKPSSPLSSASAGQALLRCVVCCQPFDFSTGETAVVLRHIAYGHDFAHPGACLAAALEWTFVEPTLRFAPRGAPGYDRPAFSLDGERTRIHGTTAADGWVAVMPETCERILGGQSARFESLLCWALVEHRNGSRRTEGIIRDADLEDEPGAAEFPEAGRRPSIDYASRSEVRSSSRRAQWEALIQAQYRGQAERAA